MLGDWHFCLLATDTASAQAASQELWDSCTRTSNNPDAEIKACTHPRWPGDFSHIQLDFYGEGSVHADVVGGLEGMGQRPRAPRLNGGALGGGSARMRRGGSMEDHPMAKSNSVERDRNCGPGRVDQAPAPMNAKKGGKTAKAPKRQTHRKGAVATRSSTQPAIRKQTKQQTCIDLLSRKEGATIEELQAATGWQQHSVRGFLAGAVRKKLGLTLVSERPDERPRRYRISNSV